MIPSSIDATPSREDWAISRLAAAAVALAIAEAALPSPLPGVKPGLANVVTLVVLWRFGWRAAAWVSLLRVLVASLVLGSFLSPGFVLSLAGALASLAALGLAQGLPRRWFGPVAHSIVAAFAHLVAQLAVVYLWLIPSPALWSLLPLFSGAALLFGVINGVVAHGLLASAASPETAMGSGASKAG